MPDVNYQLSIVNYQLSAVNQNQEKTTLKHTELGICWK